MQPSPHLPPWRRPEDHHHPCRGVHLPAVEASTPTIAPSSDVDFPATFVYRLPPRFSLSYPSHDHVHRPHDPLHEDRRSSRPRHLFPPAHRPGLHEVVGHRGRGSRHLPRRTHPRPFPRVLEGGAAHPRFPHRAWKTRHHPRGEHREAPQCERLRAAADGGHLRTPSPGLRPARLPRFSRQRPGKRRQGPLRSGQGERREPRPARGQFRPPRPQGSEGLRQGQPPFHGQMVARFEDPRRYDERRRLLRE